MPNPSELEAENSPRLLSRLVPHLPWVSAILISLALLSYFLIVPFVEQANQIAAMKKDDAEVAGKMLLYKSELVLKVATFIAGLASTVVVIIGAWATVQKLAVDRESMAATRLSTATAQLGALAGSDPNIDGRLGGLYGVEALSSLPRLYWPSIEILSNYVRTACERHPAAPTRNANALRTDIRVALRILGRSTPNDKQPGKRPGDHKDLRHANLRGAELWGYNLKETDFAGSDLTDAHMEGGFFSFAKFERATLTNARIGDAEFEGASFDEADVSGCDFSSARKMHKRQLANVARRDGTIDPP